MMNEEVQSRLIMYLDKLEEFAKSGVDLAVDQIPQVLQEYVTHARTESTIGVVVGATFLVVALICAIKLTRFDFSRPPNAKATVLLSGAVVGVMLSIPILSMNIQVCIKSWVAPRVLLLEKLNEMR